MTKFDDKDKQAKSAEAATEQVADQTPDQTQVEKSIVMSATDFASLGDGHIGYVRSISGADAIKLVGPVPDLPADAKLYALLAADGRFIALSDSRDGAVASAFEHDLAALSVH